MKAGVLRRKTVGTGTAWPALVRACVVTVRFAGLAGGAGSGDNNRHRNQKRLLL